jgi:hypothetical protein
MLKKTMTYKDLDGNLVTEDFYFNLTRAELTLLGLDNEAQNIEARLRKMIEARDGKAIVEEFVRILELAYGKRSEDGKRFMKKPEYWEEFTQTEAYSDLVMEILTGDGDWGAEFIKGLMPSDMRPKIEEQLAAMESKNFVAQHTAADPHYYDKIHTPRHLSEYTMQELEEMSRADFEAVAGKDPRKMTKDALVVAMRWMTNQ